jgi:adenylate kinase family enzyme
MSNPPYCDRVPLLGPHDPLPFRPKRVLVAGTSGSGKSALASRLSRALELPYVEIDALFHGPSWTPRESFEREVDEFSAGSRWTTEWQYEPARPMLAERADLIVWLDLSRLLVMSQVIRRTLHRRRTREVLWNGNLEPPLWTILTDREHIIRWAWSTHGHTRTRIAAVQRQRPDLPIVVLRDHTDSDEWLNSIGRRRWGGGG